MRESSQEEIGAGGGRRSGEGLAFGGGERVWRWKEWRGSDVREEVGGLYV